jgi:hypothetical protein
MVNVSTAHTAHLEPSVRTAARGLLDEVFAGELTDADWEHALGGIHALAWDSDVLVGHASVIQRRLWLGGPTPDDDGGIHVLPVTLELDLTSEITAEWRDSDVW